MKTKKVKQHLGLLLVLLLTTISSFAQQINLDKVVRAGELTLFQELRNPKAYYYVIDKPRLARDANGVPKFSFLRYVENVRSGASAPELREGEGGGIVHAVIELGVTKEQRDEAQRDLQSIAPEATIKGPVIYKEGTIALISSFVKADGVLSKQVIGIGKAPLLDGQRAAVSIQLTKKGAKILWESFRTPTPDMSISFEMGLTGYRSPKRAIIEADFEQIYQHKNFQAGVASPVLAAEIKTAFDDMVKKGAIKVVQIGSDEKLDKVMETAYNKILSMMFQPAGGTGTPNISSLIGNDGKTNLLDKATTLLNAARKDARKENTRIRKENQKEMDRIEAERRKKAAAGGSGTTADAKKKSKRPNTSKAARAPKKTPEHLTKAKPSDPPKPKPRLQREETVPAFAIALSFQMKRVRQKGVFKIDLNKYTTDNITLRFDRNFGDVDCDACMREINIDPSIFKQRELVAFVDGANTKDFGDYINFVTVALKKKHHGGDISTDEVRIDRNNFNAEGNNFKLLYGWNGDNDRSKWLDYEYKTTWSFFGDHKMESEWVKSDVGAFALAPPYLKRTITVEADPEAVKQANIRAIDIKFFYKIGEKEQTKSMTLITRKEELSKTLDIILPRNVQEYQYEVTWTLKRNKKVNSGKMQTNSSVLFVDELP